MMQRQAEFTCRIILRKTASHFCWKCFVSTHLPHAKPLRTFAGNAFYIDQPSRDFSIISTGSLQLGSPQSSLRPTCA
ncbi:hypothetical protein F3W84_20800 [Ochrobactrum quorumnocens]|uniref:Uncharacterized protein n=1 Tax=Ochrobactrum quorumnocens TaxID=271865 RepID=A0A5N1JP89_9HYPH|nr:hypothetical protein F3W84_20800 [[Ochrobactrum] quorumnocens]